MYVKLSFGNLNFNPCFSHPTSIYTCEVTTAPRVCGGGVICFQSTPMFNYYLKNYKLMITEQKERKYMSNDCDII